MGLSRSGGVSAAACWRIAVAVWSLFALIIAALTLASHDEVRLTDPSWTRLVGSIVSRHPDGSITFRVRESGDQPAEVRTLRPDEIGVLAPYGHRSVTGNYRAASEHWRRGEPLYTSSVHGFLYPPQAALVFLPFGLLPHGAGEVLWRWAGIVAYAAGVWVLCRRLVPGRAVEAFVWASALSCFAAMGSARNGQANLVMAGLLALGAVDASNRRFWRSTLWLMLALACKPVAAPVVLLLAAAYPRLIWPLAVGGAALLAAPFIHPDPVYVLEQYGASLSKMRAAAAPGAEGLVFSDLRGMLRDFGVTIGESAMLPVRAGAAIACLGLCVWIARRTAEPDRVVGVLTLGLVYTLVFGPRTEGVTYALIGPVAGVLFAGAILSGRWTRAVMLGAYGLVLQFSMLVTDPLTGRERKYWLRPLLTLAVGAMVVVDASLSRRHSSGDGPSTRPTPG
jgi:hypothetical protein